MNRSEIKLNLLLRTIGISKGKYFHWKKRLGKENQHNFALPKINWLLPFEREAIINYAKNHYAENDYYLRDGYRRLTYRMLDEDVVAVSPSSVYRILKSEGLLNQWNTVKSSSKGNGFSQPDSPHKHWHIDIKYINFKGTFLFLISVMDGYSRYIVHHELRANMSEYDVEITVQRAKEKYLDVSPRIISDNGGQFISKDFRQFIRFLELTHVKTSIAYPQANGKLERFHRSLSIECLNTNSFITIEDAREIIAKYIDYYNRVRLHSAIFYLSPEDFLLGRQKERIAQREQKLQQAALNREEYWSNNVAA
ncbi:MAG: DDE-type integrase/transposase/recombinase [Nitrospirota bacterium]|jgi:transposase InsO family protein